MVALLAPTQPNKQKSNEWYTPSRYIEAARLVMGGIDLDPASCELANETVKASRYYTVEENGLAQAWRGSVWLNPPYRLDNSLPNERRSNIAKWVNCLVSHFQNGNISQAVLLVTAQSDASWFDLLWQYPLCFTNHKIRFFLPYGSQKKSRPGRMTDGHMFGTVFAYLGPHEQKFIDIFSQFGRIAKAVDTPRNQVQPLSMWEAS